MTETHDLTSTSRPLGSTADHARHIAQTVGSQAMTPCRLLAWTPPGLLV
jgi:hypothetical protein